MYGPNGVIADDRGNLYIADLHNNVVRKVDVTTALLELSTRYRWVKRVRLRMIALSDIGSASLSSPHSRSLENFQLQPLEQHLQCRPAGLRAPACFLGVAFRSQHCARQFSDMAH